MTRGEQHLTDRGEGLLRRWQRKPVLDQVTGRLRAPRAAFEPRFPDPTKPNREVDEALSVNVESSLRSVNLSLTWGITDPVKQYMARVTVADCAALTLEAWHAPIRTPDHPENPHHGLIWGLVEMHADDELRYEQTVDALGHASTIATD